MAPSSQRGAFGVARDVHFRPARTTLPPKTFLSSQENANLVPVPCVSWARRSSMRRLTPILAAALLAVAPAEEPATVSRLVVGTVAGNDAEYRLTSEDGACTVLLEPDSSFGGAPALAALAGKRCAVIAEFPAGADSAK